MSNHHIKKIKFKIHGTHCASCEVLIERKFKKLAGIEKVKVNFSSGKAELLCSREPKIWELEKAIKEDGYRVSKWSQEGGQPKGEKARNTPKDYFHIGGTALTIVALYYLLKQFDLVPVVSIADRMSYGLIFLIGLFAAISSCIAVVGGLLLAVAGKYNELHPDLTGIQKFRPHIFFNLGRIVGYTVFGALVGSLGSIISLSAQANGYLIILVSIIMLLLGFQLLHLFPGLQRFSPKMPKFIAHRVHDMSEQGTKGTSFVLGSLTFFLPCGFTQALQLYVLASGDWKVGALTMLTFSLGTMPALLSLSALSSFAKGQFQKQFLRFAGVLVVLLAIFNINSGLTLAGYNLTSFLPGSGSSQNVATPTPIVNGKQIVKMTASGYTYSPNQFTVLEGIPVEWQIDGGKASGCGKVLVMPTLGISKYLSTQGITTITFTPTQTGTIPFNCSMGMMTRGSQFNVIPNTSGVTGNATSSNESVGANPNSSCDPSIADCVGAQKVSLEVSRERGVYPRSLTVKKGIPVELTIDDKVALGGCMSVWIIPKYNVTIPMKVGEIKTTFTPTEPGTIAMTCSMGSKMAEITVI